MKKKIIILFISFISIICIAFFILNKKEEKEYIDNLFYMDTNIYIKIYSNNENKATKALKEINNIYEEYHKLSDRYKHYNGITNIYDILHNSSKEEYLKIDSKLYDMISYGLEWFDKSNGLLDIRIGNIIDIWKVYQDTKSGIPSLSELNIAKANMVENIELKDNNYILNNHPNIDLSKVVKGYTTQIVGEYLESIGITKYIINAGGNVKVGKHYNNSLYSIGIEDPNSSVGDIYKVVYGSDISVVTKGNAKDYFEYNGERYHYIINPNTLFPPNYSKSVTVITNNSALGEILSTILFLLPIEEGKKFINDMNNVEVIWYTNENEIIKTTGFTKYEN